ncbi:MAG: PAS domain-containing protein [bacterium]
MSKITKAGKEYVLRDDDFIVSKTLPNGILSYCNRVFIEISGYSENELLGKPHNILRHPDMPRTVFDMLWANLKNGKEFNGFVKNQTKDKGFYWVFANVTPNVSPDGELLGYFSVRRKPSAEKLSLIEPIYKKMRDAENAVSRSQSIEASKLILQQELSKAGVSYEEFIL